MSTLSRGDALAAAVSRYLDGMRSEIAEAELVSALDDYRFTTPTGERVRLAVVLHPGPKETYPIAMPEKYLRNDQDVYCYVEFTIPPRPSVPVVEGECE